LVGSLLIATLLISLLSGCGFHLRGLNSVGESQFKTVQLNNLMAASSEIQKALRSQLKSSGIVLVDSISEAEVQITLQATLFKASRTAYSGQGDATAEMLKMTQSFSAISVSSEQPITAGSVETYRDRQIETNAMLAADNELNSIKQEMAELLARQLMDRINRALSKLKTVDLTLDTKQIEQSSKTTLPTNTDSVK